MEGYSGAVDRKAKLREFRMRKEKMLLAKDASVTARTFHVASKIGKQEALVKGIRSGLYCRQVGPKEAEMWKNVFADMNWKGSHRTMVVNVGFLKK